MYVFPHVYWRLKAVDLHVPARLKDLYNEIIPATKKYAISSGNVHFYFKSCKIDDEKKLRSQTNLINSIYEFGDCLNDLTNESEKNPYCRQTYKILMTRRVWLYVPDLPYNYHVYDSSRVMTMQPMREDFCEFVYSRVGYYIYSSNIREVLGCNFKHINLIDNFGHVKYDQESNIDPNAPLYVYSCDDKEVTVRKIDKDEIVVHGEHLYQIGTETTPSQILSLLQRRYEPIRKGVTR